MGTKKDLKKPEHTGCLLYTSKTLNPLVNSDESVDAALSLMYEKLIVIDESGKAQPNIAESWTFDEDGSTAYINLKNNVCFSDGTRLTAYDVAYSLKTIDNAENSYYKNCVDNIKTWSVTCLLYTSHMTEHRKNIMKGHTALTR